MVSANILNDDYSMLAHEGTTYHTFSSTALNRRGKRRQRKRDIVSTLFITKDSTQLSTFCVSTFRLTLIGCTAKLFSCCNLNAGIVRERGGVVVERRTPNREVLGSIPTGAIVLCP